jgi:obg-like ATPase 1
MPPKKKEEPVKKVILGRASNTLKMGLVGLPNVGKSTTFNALSNLNVPAENFPFCTIDPNVAKIHVPDKRFEHLCELFKPKSKVLAQFSITDIAGLVKGASTGAGLGNAFLSHIAAVDGIFHVVRAFPNEEIIHEEGEIDPIRDIEIINGELIAKDLQSVAKTLESLEAEIKRKNQKVHRDERDVIQKVKENLDNGVFVRDVEWKAGEIDTLNKHLYITAKPTVYLVNIGYEQYKT